ncbi:extracellular matrix protein 2-like [Brienomyrus brachyistius]|uniref:extracellular matrix protein 2-like n=1 Tax=Brienomyrus brachyistius TaxID=42636 RepID=UPI0020B2AA02|nr:extracellular matrix protein 2-like [Brienomyrus brachyistius]
MFIFVVLWLGACTLTAPTVEGWGFMEPQHQAETAAGAAVVEATLSAQPILTLKNKEDDDGDRSESMGKKGEGDDQLLVTTNPPHPASLNEVKDDTEREAQSVNKQLMDEDDESDEDEDESDEEDNDDEDDKDDSEEDGDDNDNEDEEDDEDKEEEVNNGHADPLPDAKLANRTSFTDPLPDGCRQADSRITCQGLYITHLPNITGLGVTAFQLSASQVRKIPVRSLAGLPHLEGLDLRQNELTDTSLAPTLFRNLSILKKLNLDNNNLTKIPLLPQSLEVLKINDNKISWLTPQSFKGLFKLLTLELQGNGLHEGKVSPLTFRPLRKLIHLRLDDNQFRAIPSGLPPSLQRLRFSQNQLEELTVNSLKLIRLKVLDLSQNRLQDARIAPQAWTHLPLLEVLDLSHNELLRIPSFLPVPLRQLSVHHNQIGSIPGLVFSHLRPGLVYLHLAHNRLDEGGLETAAFQSMEDTLVQLLLDHNQLRSVPLALPRLRALRLLRLDHNLIRYIPPNSICGTQIHKNSTLVSLHLENNPIDCSNVQPATFSCVEDVWGLHPQCHKGEE